MRPASRPKQLSQESENEMIKFADNWNQENPQYVALHGTYQAFLDAITKDVVRQALVDAAGHFNSQQANDMFAAANAQNDSLEIRQGTHQPENRPNGGYALHLTAKRTSGPPTYHLYVGQNPDGTFFIQRISWGAGNNQREDRH